MSVGMCVGVAEAMGMRYAGLEYRRECWVGERLVEEGRNGVAVAEGECGFSCWGERGGWGFGGVGGGGGEVVYAFGGWSIVRFGQDI